MKMHWYWLVCGILMILMEFGIKGRIICFFGVSALLAAIAYMVKPMPMWWQLVIFCGGGILLAAGYHLLGKVLKKCFSKNPPEK